MQTRHAYLLEEHIDGLDGPQMHTGARDTAAQRQHHVHRVRRICTRARVHLPHALAPLPPPRPPRPPCPPRAFAPAWRLQFQTPCLLIAARLLVARWMCKIMRGLGALEFLGRGATARQGVGRARKQPAHRPSSRAAVYLLLCEPHLVSRLC